MEDEEVAKIIEEFKETYPKDFFKLLDKNACGVCFILSYLDSHNEECHSKDICNESGLSSARVAVLLKKMEAKNLIKKSESQDDARFTIVRLTSDGKKEIEEMKKESFKRAKKIINKVGMNDIKEFMRISKSITQAMKE